MVPPLRIAFVSEYDSNDVERFSGIPFFMAHAVRDVGGCVVRIGPLRRQREHLHRPRRWATRKLGGPRYLLERQPAITQSYARQIERALRRVAPDVVLGLSAIPLAHLRIETPIVYWSDATFASLLEYYEDFSGVAPRSIELAHELEQAVLDRCRLALFSSAWAARGAMQHYDVARDKVHVLPFGANLTAVPATDAITRIVRGRPASPCHLLVIAVDWHRKGCDRALEVARRLNARRLSTTLTVVGCEPPPGTLRPPWLRSCGYVSKRRPEGMRRLELALSQTHFSLVASRADCAPVAIAESNAFGVPVLAAPVGGIPTLVEAGRNGLLIDGADIDAYVDAIEALMEDREAYETLAHRARAEYDARLEWRVNAGSLTAMLRELVGPRAP